MKEPEKKQECIITEFDSTGKPIKVTSVSHHEMFLKVNEALQKANKATTTKINIDTR